MTPERVAFGPLDRWLTDPAVNEVMVNAGGDVWIERADGPPGVHYAARLAPGELDAAVERILLPVGRRLDRRAPIVDARLPDGSRVCAVIEPVAVDGTTVSIRRFVDQHTSFDDFVADSGDASEVAPVVRGLVTGRRNVVVSGATSTGKTTLLGVLARWIPANERIITLEDTCELALAGRHVVRLEARPPTIDGVTAITVEHLLRAALRLRPDRLVLGEVRGDEALELVQALNTGHDGTLATVHANSPLDALARLESLVIRAAPSWPLDAVRQQVARCLHSVIHLERTPDGKRRIAAIADVLPPTPAGPSVALRWTADGARCRA
jgi:pilus assembly protein CpaF